MKFDTILWILSPKHVFFGFLFSSFLLLRRIQTHTPFNKLSKERQQLKLNDQSSHSFLSQQNATFNLMCGDRKIRTCFLFYLILYRRRMHTSLRADVNKVLIVAHKHRTNRMERREEKLLPKMNAHK